MQFRGELALCDIWIVCSVGCGEGLVEEDQSTIKIGLSLLRNTFEQAKYTSITKQLEKDLRKSKFHNESIPKVTMKHLSPKFPNYRPLVRKALQYNGMLLEFVSEELKNDFEIIGRACYNTKKALLLVSNKKTLMEFIKKKEIEYWWTQYVCTELTQDEEITLAALMYHSFPSDRNRLENSPNVRKDPSLIDIYQKRWWLVKFTHEELRSNKKFMLEIIKRHSRAMIYASEELRNDEEEVLKLVEFYDVKCFKYISEKLKNNWRFVFKVVRRYGKVYEYLTKEMQNDADIASEAVKSSRIVYSLLPKKLRSNVNIALEAFSGQYDFPAFKFVLRSIPACLKSDRAFALELVDKFGYALFHLNPIFRSDREIVGRAVRSFWNALSIASGELKQDREIVGQAADNFIGALKLADPAIAKSLNRECSFKSTSTYFPTSTYRRFCRAIEK